MSRLTPRKGMPSPRLNEDEFRKRFLAQFQDPAFDSLARELDGVVAAAWDAYSHSRKAPRTCKAGAEFADPDYELSVDWLAARAAIADAQRRHADRTKPAILLINCSSRSEHTCPGEMSKSYRLAEIAREVFAAAQADDGPSRLCGRRQSRSHAHARQGRGAGEADRARGLGLPPASRGSAVLRRRAWRRRGRRERATEHFRLALLHAPLCRGSDGRTRSLHRLLEALCHQPRQSRRRFGRSRGGAQRRPHVTRGGARQARRQVRNRGRRLAGAAAKVSFGPRQALDASQRVYRRGDERALKNSRWGARRPRPVCLVWACSKLQQASVD